MTGLRDADALLEWCSYKGSGTIRAFEAACRSVMGATVKARRVLWALEMSGHLEVDWVKRDTWWIAPPVLSLLEGAGGNAVLQGSRSPWMLKQLEQPQANMEIRSLALVSANGGDGADPALSPTAVFVGVQSLDELRSTAETIGAEPKTSTRLEYMRALPPLQECIHAGESQYTSSGVRAQKLNVHTLRFETHEVLHGQWQTAQAGCYRQQSYGRPHYLFVDDEKKLHNLDKWVAVHAELNRARAVGALVVPPISFDRHTDTLLCDARAQLPTMWGRAAVMCTGLLPRRRSVGDHMIDEYRGVLGATYARICDTLGYPDAKREHGRG